MEGVEVVGSGFLFTRRLRVGRSIKPDVPKPRHGDRFGFLDQQWPAGPARGRAHHMGCSALQSRIIIGEEVASQAGEVPLRLSLKRGPRPARRAAH